jgi:sulfur transfer protein SufE
MSRTILEALWPLYFAADNDAAWIRALGRVWVYLALYSGVTVEELHQAVNRGAEEAKKGAS